MGPDTLPTDATDPRIGLVLQDRYKIVRKLGEGGMGAVYEGEHVLIKRRVAIKCLHAHYANSPEIVARFHREALAATSIRHPNIVEVTDMGRFADGAFFMVLEYLDGRDWAADLAKAGPQPLGRVVHIMSQVCDALSAAHEKGIVHRDLKPENVFLCQRGDDPDFAKVLDFGISKMQDGDADPARSKGLTRTGMAMGTPYYMAPEQAQGKKDIDHRADIYALGVILFQALTNQYPFDDDSYPMLVVKICTEDAPPITRFRPDLPPEIEALVARMLTKNPSERPATCAAVKAALAPFRALTEMPSALSDVGHRSTGVMGGQPIGSDRPNPIPKTTPGAISGTRPLSEKTSGTQPRSDTAGAQPHSVVGASDPTSLGSAITSQVLQPSERAEPRRRTPYAFASAAIGGLVLLGASAYFALGRPTEIADVPPVNTELVREPVEATPAPNTLTGDTNAQGAQALVPAAEPTTVPTTVRVQISTEPEDATIYLDDHRIPNPFDADLPQSTTPRNLRVEREGYVTNVQDLVLEFPQRVRVRLDRGRGVNDHRAVVRERPPPSRSTTPATPAEPTTSRTPEAPREPVSPPVVSAPTPREPEPEPDQPTSAPDEAAPEGERRALKNPFRRR
jgi:serine/threonine-protein kinase